jgi:hypothetical protein
LTGFAEFTLTSWVTPLLLLWSIFLLDLWFGDPVYRFHPIRLIGYLLGYLERWLFARRWSGYTGGILLGLLLLGIVLGCYLPFAKNFRQFTSSPRLESGSLSGLQSASFARSGDTWVTGLAKLLPMAI